MAESDASNYRMMSVQADAVKPPAGALNPNEFQEFKLIKKDKLTHDTMLYRRAN
jgi:hypothetical protein